MSEKKETDNTDGHRLSDLLKRVVTTGIGAAFMTEDTIRSLLSDIPDKKELVNGLLQNAKNSKEEFLKSMKKEVRQYLERLDMSREIDRILENYDLEVKANVKFKKKSRPKRATKDTKE